MRIEAIREHFRQQVEDYPNLMRRLIPYYDAQRDIICGLIPFESDCHFCVLDLGCGPGLLADRILGDFPNAEVTALDLTSDMLDACRERVGAIGRATYRLADFKTDDLGTGYDLIVASLALHHMELSERPGFYRRALASLNPGGVLITAEVVVDESPMVCEQQRALWREFIEQNGEDASHWYQRHLEKDHPGSVSALIDMLVEAGWANAGCWWRYLNFAIVTAQRPHPEDATSSNR